MGREGERERESGRSSERGHCVSFQSVSFGNTYRVSPQDSADGLRLGNLFKGGVCTQQFAPSLRAFLSIIVDRIIL